jgi:hypothetical protein
VFISDRGIQTFIKNKNVTENEKLKKKRLSDIFKNKNIAGK